MFAFSRPKTFLDPEIGVLRFVGGGMWLSTPANGLIGVAVQGDKNSPSLRALEAARALAKEGSALLEIAEIYVLNDANALEFLNQDRSRLVEGGFTVLETGEFEVDFSVADWPDAMITVEFLEGKPCQILLAD